MDTGKWLRRGSVVGLEQSVSAPVAFGLESALPGEVGDRRAVLCLRHLRARAATAQTLWCGRRLPDGLARQGIGFVTAGEV
jgi:hypothetical protein